MGLGVEQQAQHELERTDGRGSSQHRQSGHIVPPLCSSSAKQKIKI